MINFLNPVIKTKEATGQIQVIKGTMNYDRSQLLKKDNLISFSAYLHFSNVESIAQHENILKIPAEYCPKKEFMGTSLDIIDQDNNRNLGRVLIYKAGTDGYGNVAIQHKVSSNSLKSIVFTITYLI